jgi:hypothetical protein
MKKIISSYIFLGKQINQGKSKDGLELLHQGENENNAALLFFIIYADLFFFYL